MTANKILILGLGNEILTDDAIAIKLVDRMKLNKISDNVDFKTSSVGGLELVEIMCGYELVVLIDSIKTKEGKPGHVFRFNPDDFKETMHLTNLHDVSFLTALKLCNELNYRLPGDIEIIAVEINENMVFSDQFTPEIQANFEKIYNTTLKSVLEIIRKFNKNAHRKNLHMAN